MKDKIQLTLTEEQARVVSKACELYARIRMGQFNEIIYDTLDFGLPCEDYCERRDKAKEYLLKAREQIYPELHGEGHSYGIGKFEDADFSFDVHQVIRNQFGDGRKPFSFHELPKCIRVKGGAE